MTPAPNTDSAGEGLNVQYGVGWSPAEGWLNFDGSPSIRIERAPVVGRLLKVNSSRFPEEILYGDIIAGLPVPDQSAKAVYASHVLEHLAFNDCHTALRNTFRILKPGGVFRLIVPDLEARARLYLDAVARGDADAGNDFCDSTLFGVHDRPKGLKSSIRSLLGNSNHLWMWDEGSMTAALRDAGFVDIRRCEMGDAEDPAFAAVEAQNRFFDEKWNIRELAIEARRPEAAR